MSSKTDDQLLANSVLISGEPASDTLGTILRHLLETGSVASVFALRKTRQEGRYCYSLVSDPSMIDEILPFHPVMPVQAAEALTELTRTDSLEKPVAALMRPCEIRAYIESAKQFQGSLESLFIISCTCPGVIPASRLLADDRDTVFSEYEEAAGTGANPDSIRNACKNCTEFVPCTVADMTVVIASDTGQQRGNIHFHSEAAGKIADELEFVTLQSEDPPEKTITKLLEIRGRNRRALLGDTSSGADGLRTLVDLFSACISCRGCREACPLCSCVLCDYETARTQYSPELVRSESGKKGAQRVPSGTIQFQMGRLMHISPSCVSCGQCSDVCPVDIPVSDIFTRAAHLVQKTLDYSPGASVDDEPPMSVYDEKELQDITD